MFNLEKEITELMFLKRLTNNIHHEYVIERKRAIREYYKFICEQAEKEQRKSRHSHHSEDGYDFWRIEKVNVKKAFGIEFKSVNETKKRTY